MASIPEECDVLVVGGGNAGFSAAIAAREAGAERVVLIDKCPEEWAGGNTYFTAGAMRTVHDGLADLLPIITNVDDELAELIDMEPYSAEDFHSDMSRVTSNRCDPDLTEILVKDSNSTTKWLAKQGIRFQLSFNRQAYKVNGRYKFWGGLALKTQDGGKGLVEDHNSAAIHHGIQIYHSTALQQLNLDPTTSALTSITITHHTTAKTIHTKAVILAAGGFEASSNLRAKHLGPAWKHALVRGTPHNTGEVLEIAIRDVSAKLVGDIVGCHSTCWDANAPANSGDREISNEFTKSGYPLGVMVNLEGERFVDEGVEMRNFTYAKFGRAILHQPGSVVFQIFDLQAVPWLRDEEYRDGIVEKIWGESIETLAEKCVEKGLRDPGKFVHTIREYNQAVYRHREENGELTWDPAVKDGLSTQSRSGGLDLPKSNWALPLDQGPFLAVRVGCGVTFTFGGLAVLPETAAVVCSKTNKAVPGVYCVGEMLGGLFYGNYPGGSGLTFGAVFGRRAGRAAAEYIAKLPTKEY